MTFTINTLEELGAKAPEILKAFGERKIITFDAPMGAGKTTLIKALCDAIGTNSIVNSPTFAIINDYETFSGNSIYHFDMYRLKNIGEAIDMGFEEYIYSGSYCFIEWPEIVEQLLPDERCNVKITVGEKGERIVEVN